jgi:hypothetical protein
VLQLAIGGGGRVGRGDVGGALTGDGAAVKWPGDEVVWQWLKARGGGKLWRERGGKEGGVEGEGGDRVTVK